MVTTRIELAPFEVPTAAYAMLPSGERQDGFSPAIPLENIDPDALEGLAQLWLNNLFASVERRAPFTADAKAAPR